ncbi:acetylornithine deacetylase [Pelistega indica]|uniref:Acetylornithine deacetylase n=1 Tax=Pelistega indica TaxID=1414851 RepID=V8G946_9BURK|nr:acetylornithine deacetylase [Pelistega indica]ETD72232.1 acetylornithine deacetylase [Pelistega indica]
MNAQQWLEKLVSFDTTSRYSNLALIQEVQQFLTSFGYQCSLSHNADNTKANLFATLPSSTGETQGGIALSGHTDVVPVDKQIWETSPFELTEKGSRLYGRGTCDMKGFIACCLAIVPKLVELERRKPIHFAFSYDEEIGCLGAPVMLEALKKKGQQIDGCVVGEPTNMRVVVAHKGINVFSCIVHGKAAHSSLTPRGCNAIEHAARLICHIRDLADIYRQQGPFDNDYDVPYTTMTSNMIQGGIAVNTIPELCQFNYEFRNLPGIPKEEIQAKIDAYVKDELIPRMKKEFPDANIEISEVSSSPGLEASEEAAITTLARELLRDSDTTKVAYGTEAGLFQKAGIPTIVCGPGHIEQAHKANEFIEKDQLQACEDFLLKLLKVN